MKDKQIYKLIQKEKRRQKEMINLIASENIVSDNVCEALGSVFTNKYAEGYPHLRYYGGNEVTDKLEEITKERALKLFRLSPKKWSVNVQPYSGSPANLAVLHALVPIGAKIMAMALPMGGHLTHGHKASITGKLWKQVAYGVSEKTGRIDYDAVMRIAKKENPKIIIAGATAYSRIINFKKFKQIANAVGAVFMVDMSHFAGLVAGRVYPSPFIYADVVTTTTHKTLRGPRAALIFSKIEFSKAIDKTVFPGLQGGPHMNQIAGIAVALKEARKPEFKKYSRQIIKNARTLAKELKKYGWKIISNGTDTHLFLMDTIARGVSGKIASGRLESAGIIVNKNMIPFDLRKPSDPSGIRVGTPTVTTRGMKEREMKIIAGIISKTLLREEKENEIKTGVAKLCRKFLIKL